MRQLTVSIGVGDQQGRYFEDLEATVNTRSTFTAIPRTLLQKLGVPVTRSARARLADGTTAPIDLGCVLIRLDGQVFPTQVIFAEDDQNSVLGRVTLEAALLAVDPQQQCLVPVDLDISRPRHLSNNAEPDNGPWDNLDALFADAELPFGHPGRNFDDSPPGTDRFDDHYEPPPPDPPDEGTVHYGPGGRRPLCDTDSGTAVHTEDPDQVRGCADCLELVAEDLEDNNPYAGRCLHCLQQITAVGGVAWRRIVRSPCPHCGKPGW